MTAIRTTGATSQIILLPGNNYTSAETFISSGSAAALNMVRNPDGTITNLVMDVHKYLDYDNSYVPGSVFLRRWLNAETSGTHAECVTNNIESSWYPLSTWLRENGRQALNTETGGGDVDSCVGYLSQQIGYQAANSDGQSSACTMIGLQPLNACNVRQSSSATLDGPLVPLRRIISSARRPTTMAPAGMIP